MFKNLFGNKLKKLEKEYSRLLEKAVHAQRNGDMALFAKLSKEAENIGQKMDEMKANQEG
tara:strand:- start:1328 stop:1507 length:180 start_codon:yes stop_codon:yes gene_type:complete